MSNKYITKLVIAMLFLTIVYAPVSVSVFEAPRTSTVHAQSLGGGIRERTGYWDEQDRNNRNNQPEIGEGFWERIKTVIGLSGSTTVGSDATVPSVTSGGYRRAPGGSVAQSYSRDERIQWAIKATGEGRVAGNTDILDSQIYLAKQVADMDATELSIIANTDKSSPSAGDNIAFREEFRLLSAQYGLQRPVGLSDDDYEKLMTNPAGLRTDITGGYKNSNLGQLLTKENVISTPSTTEITSTGRPIGTTANQTLPTGAAPSTTGAPTASLAAGTAPVAATPESTNFEVIKNLTKEVDDLLNDGQGDRVLDNTELLDAMRSIRSKGGISEQVMNNQELVQQIRAAGYKPYKVEQWDIEKATAPAASQTAGPTTPQGNTGPNPVEKNLSAGTSSGTTTPAVTPTPAAGDSAPFNGNDIDKAQLQKIVTDYTARIEKMNTTRGAEVGLAYDLQAQAESLGATLQTLPVGDRLTYWNTAYGALKDGEKLLGEVIKSDWGDSIKAVNHKEEYEGGPDKEGSKNNCDLTEDTERGKGITICNDDGSYDHHNAQGNFITRPTKCFNPDPMDLGIFQLLDFQSKEKYNQNGVCGNRSAKCVANEGFGSTLKDGIGKNKDSYQRFCGNPERIKTTHKCPADRKVVSCSKETQVPPDEILDRQFTLHALGKEGSLASNMVKGAVEEENITLPDDVVKFDNVDAFNHYVTQDWASDHATAAATFVGTKILSSFFPLGSVGVNTLSMPQNADLQHPLLYNVKALAKNLDPKNPNGCANDSSLFGDTLKIQQCAFAHAIYNASTTSNMAFGGEVASGLPGEAASVQAPASVAPADDSDDEDSWLEGWAKMFGNQLMMQMFGNLMNIGQYQPQAGQQQAGQQQSGQQQSTFPTQQFGQGIRTDVPQITLRVGERRRIIVIGGNGPYGVSGNGIYRATPIMGNSATIEFEGTAVGQAMSYIYSINNPTEAYINLPVTVTDASGNVYPAFPGQAPSTNDLDQYRPTANPGTGLIVPPTCCLTPGP